ncbi:slit homolog 2 protein-like isoform X4 [Apostichopus japonicus]|uniref:slit homolog 2 protein-like isoform X4 n=1 Tax=Stichopus japonicus TaxID=307972 RepID=UPI003AB601B1
MKLIHAFGYLLLTLIFSSFVEATDTCPRPCSCYGSVMDCRERGLLAVPNGIPHSVERLYLAGNNITDIRRDDFNGLRALRVITLSDNAILNIERGAFHGLISLERLRLNNNKLQNLPELLFSKMGNLYTLDLSNNRLLVTSRKLFRGLGSLRNLNLSKNKLMSLPRQAFRGLNSLRKLRLDGNRITCIMEGSFRPLRMLESLALNENNLTTLSSSSFTHMSFLKNLRLTNNNLMCDCYLSWLSVWLRLRPQLGLQTECAGPRHVRGVKIVELQPTDFRCPGGESHEDLCEVEPLCPKECSCQNEIVDCRGRGLSELPEMFPYDMTEVMFGQNQIRTIGSRAFSKYKKLTRLDFSNNQIETIAPDAFLGLRNLHALVLYGNLLRKLPEGIFRGLTSLDVLLLNANQLTCVQTNLFQDLVSLTLLSLYDNQVQSLANSTFDSMRSLKTLHLGRNPFICDCNLKWLADYLDSNPVEVSGARCTAPARMNNKRLAKIKSIKFKCRGAESFRTERAGECFIDHDCPEECDCDGAIVDCSNKGLPSIPEGIPTYTTELRMNGNELTRISNDGLFHNLQRLKKLDLRENRISIIEEGAFDGAVSVAELRLRGNRLTCITNETFLGLKSMRDLSLYDNSLTSIMPDAFESLTNLHTLNLLENPLNCNCHLSWLPDFLKSREIETGNPRCNEPSSIRDRTIEDLRAEQFSCNGDDFSSCEPAPDCPSECACINTVVRCSRKELVTPPQNIPLEATELYLDANMLTTIPNGMERLKSLHTLDLSRNRISILPENAFANMSSLSTLLLNVNQIGCIPPGTFTGLHQLRILSLYDNNISTIPQGSFTDMDSLTHIALGLNPLHCDCQMEWLSEWVKDGFKEPGIASCAKPDVLAGKLLLTAPTRKFVCTEEPDIMMMAKCDPCISEPCMNNAECRVDPVEQYICTCPPGFKGRNCEAEVNECEDWPCMNGGSCVDLHGSFRCECMIGYEGEVCQTNTDDCAFHQCMNGGSCVDGINSLTCTCQLGYKGDNCEIDIDLCETTINPCQNGGVCFDLGDHYRCECPPGFRGTNCTESYEDCRTRECANGGECIQERTQFVCRCPSEFMNEFCHPMGDLLFSISPCDCQNAGKCDTNTSQCLCRPGYIGDKCQTVVSMTFSHRRSLLVANGPDTSSMVNFAVSFATEQENGVLLYLGDEEHFAVELFRGRVRVSYDVGNFPAVTMHSQQKLNDGEFHTLQLVVAMRNVSMKVDTGPWNTITNKGERERLSLDAPLYVGGLPADNEKAVKNWHLRNETSFMGCMKEVSIDGVHITPSQAVSRHGVMEGCAVLEVPNPCIDHDCQRGTCRHVNDFTYSCDCPDGWMGERCEQRTTCEGIKRKYYHLEDGCRSIQEVAAVDCSGNCGSGRCEPSRTRFRRVKMECQNGNTYSTTVELTKDCECGSL